jgi:transposase-like protein
MKAEQQKQAESLYFQTGLSKTEIAQIIGVSRRTVHYWVRHNHWDRIREAAQVMPVALAGNCYLILAKLQESILSEDRADKPVTLQEVNAMHRLTITIGKLKDRGTLNENLEMMTTFMEYVNKTNPPLADVFGPVVKDYIRSRAGELSVPTVASLPIKEDPAEALLDQQDIAAWNAEGGNSHATSATEQQHAPATTATSTTGNDEGSKAIPGKPELSKLVSKSPAPHVPDAKHTNRAARRLAARMAA